MKKLIDYKDQANRLRKQGLSYNEIRKTIPVSKSTLSLWLKGVLLSPKLKKRLYTKQIEFLSFGASSQKERRAREVQQIIESAEQEIQSPLDKETLRMMGAALYWAEGSKGKMLELTNSDPHLILFFVRWMKSIFGIEAQNLRARLNIYPQQDEAKIKKFWSDMTGIPVSSFGKSYVKPISTGYKKNNLYYGTIRVEVPKSVDMRYKVFGWIKGSLKGIDGSVRQVQRKWAPLVKVSRPVNLISDKPAPIA